MNASKYLYRLHVRSRSDTGCQPSIFGKISHSFLKILFPFRCPITCKWMWILLNRISKHRPQNRRISRPTRSEWMAPTYAGGAVPEFRLEAGGAPRKAGYLCSMVGCQRSAVCVMFWQEQLEFVNARILWGISGNREDSYRNLVCL